MEGGKVKIKTLFMTASGFLSAILLVWATLWVASAQMKPDDLTETTGIGLVYVYWGILASMLAFTLTMFKRGISAIAVVSLGTSLVITFLQVLSSLATVIWKMVVGLQVWDRLEILSGFVNPQSPLFCLLYIGIPIFIFIFCALLVWWIPCSKKLFNPNEPNTLFKEG